MLRENFTFQHANVFDDAGRRDLYYFDDFEMKIYLTVGPDLDEIPTFFIEV